MDVRLQSDNAPASAPTVRRPEAPTSGGPKCLNCEPGPITAATEEPSFAQAVEVLWLLHSTVGVQRQRVIIPTL